MLMVPIPRIGAAIRPATVDDIPFIDQLQKMQRDRVGFMCTSWIEARIEARQVLVADAAGYIIASDRYFKRDDCGIIYQINVAPGAQRHLIGAALVKAQFERSAYGCRLYCCWCAQDIEANRFWESLGFIPLAYRAGSEKKNKGGRVHIFWQRRVRADDHQTPYWFPAKTDSGSLREDRLVFPIPHGKHWSDQMPRIVPADAPPEKVIEDHRARKPKLASPLDGPIKHGPRQFGPPPPLSPVEQPMPEKPKPAKEPKKKADPRIIAAARELRDRWLEKLNSGELVFADARYEVGRLALGPTAVPRWREPLALPAPMAA